MDLIIQLQFQVLLTFNILGSGKIYGFGYNGYGQLGLGDTSNRTTPVEIKLLSKLKTVKILCGGFYTIAITRIINI